MNNNTTRHTARPSRLRVTLARVGAYLDRHDDAVTLSAVAFIVATVSALLAVALATDYAMRTRDALTVAVLAVALSALSGFFAYMVGSERATRRVSRRYSRHLNEQSDKHERALAEAREAFKKERDALVKERTAHYMEHCKVVDLIAKASSLTYWRDRARSERDEARRERDEARSERDEARREASRNAYALLTALEEHDAH